ncbi:MAG TPA: hypothetical protein DCZ95_11880 [Verrucomicrobia bacterium]|nr:hypothetical protein [Verrucomicrobiota bacterium]
MGRVDVRVLCLLLLVALIGSFAFAAVQLTKEQAEDFNARTLNTWAQLTKEFTAFRETSYPLVIPALLPDDAAIDWAALQNDDPEWYWDFDGGTYYFDPGSEISKQIPHDANLMVYEDIAQEELLVLSVPKTAGSPYKEEMVFRALPWPQPSKFERYPRYLDRELCKRRIVWHITLKSRRLAEKEEAQPGMTALLEGPQAFLPANPPMQTMSMESLTDLKITAIKKVSNTTEITVSYPSSYSGSIWSVYSYDMPACVYTNESAGGGGGGFEPPTNEAPCEGCSTCTTDPERSFAGLARVWALVVSNLVLTGETSTVWLDTRPLGLDTNNESCHRIVSFGSNVDEDNDGLSSAAELCIHKTQVHLSDTDLDGALDGAEIGAGTNPLNHPGDSDEDGLSDDLETVLGTDPDSADTDLDWASDGFERDQGSDPLESTNTPALFVKIDEGKGVTSCTNLSISFIGVVADLVRFSETTNFTGDALTMSNALPYSLQGSSNGLRQVYAQLQRIPYQETLTLNDAIALDTVAPVFSALSPTNTKTTNRRWIKIEGVATDAVSAVSVRVNGEWVDGVSNQVFGYDRFYLNPGSNSIEITGRDLAGNCATQCVWVLLDASGDTTAPSLTLDLCKDVVVTNGVTNILDSTTFGDSEVLYLKGSTDDETAQIVFWVFGTEGTNGAYAGNLVGTQFVGEVRLFSGSNTLHALATDAAGNTTTNIATIIRQTNYVFAITSPEAFQVMNASSTRVSGIASPIFLQATITVNGVGTVLSNAGDHITFTTTNPVPLNPDWTYLQAEAQLDGRVYYADPPINGYEIQAWALWGDGMREWHDYSPNSTQYEYHQFEDWDSSWDWNSTTCLKADYFHSSAHGYWLDENPEYSGSYEQEHTTNSVCYVSPASPYVHHGSSALDSSWEEEGSEIQRKSSSSYSGFLSFVKRSPTQETQLVVLQFPHLDYGLSMVGPVDPTAMTFRGQPGFWFNGHVSFLVPIRTGIRYTISESDFIWPEVSYYGPDPLCLLFEIPNSSCVIKNHELYHEGVTNHQVRVMLDSYSAMNSPKEFKVCETTFDSPCMKDPAKEDVQCLTIYYNEVFNYNTRILQQLDVGLLVSPMDLDGISWSKVSGPNSGELIDPNNSEAIFRNPTKGGVYQFEVSIRGQTTRAQLWLPVAGPDISYYWQNEIDYFKNTWGPAYRSKLNDRTILLATWPLRRIAAKATLATADMDYLGGDLDWNGTISGQNTPCGLPSSASAPIRLTIKEVVVDWKKRNNMMYGLIGKEMGIPEPILYLGGDPRYNPFAIGAPDTPATRASYRAGFDLSDGDSLQDVMNEHGYDMQEPDSATQREWPSPEISTDSLNRIGQSKLEELIQ